MSQTPMTPEQQFAAVNSSTFLADLLAKAADTMATLSTKHLIVDKIGFPVDGVVVTVIMPKGGTVAHIQLGDRGDGTAVVDMPSVPIAWLTPASA